MTGRLRTVVVLMIVVMALVNLQTKQATAVSEYAAPPAGQPDSNPFLEGPDEPVPIKPPLRNGRTPERTPVFTTPATQTGAQAPETVATELSITLWHGDEQTVGVLGETAPAFNLLGSVQGPSEITSLRYRLNGDAWKTASVGPTNYGLLCNAPEFLSYRLVGSGDFNLEILSADLAPGLNAVEIEATDADAQTQVKTVTLLYTPGRVWSYEEDVVWDAVTEPWQAANIIDGSWRRDEDGIRPIQLGYDRLVGIGDRSWTDYEVIVPLTVHGIDAQGFAGINNGPGVGVILRWPGHYDDVNCPAQPNLGWQRLGALGWYHWGVNNTEGKELLGFGYSWIGTNADETLAFDTPYFLKMSVITTPGGPYYGFKLWQQSQPEPEVWDIEGYGAPAGPQSGSVVLVSHWVDVTFGNVSVRSLSDEVYTVTGETVGQGTITGLPDDPVPGGTTVTLEAQPAPGWEFSGWSGALAGATNPVEFIINENVSVMASFTELPPEQYTLTISRNGEGIVDVSPEKPTYQAGEQITLTATPGSGWRFLNWTGAVSDETPQVTLTMTGNLDVTANFERDEYRLTTMIDGEGAVTANPAQTTYRYGDVVTLEALPALGWRFVGWSGDVSGDASPLAIVVKGDMTVTAEFEIEQYSATLNVSGQGTVARSPQQATYQYGDEVTFSATAAPGWTFVNWTGDANTTQNPYTMTVTKDISLTAIFAPADGGTVFLPLIRNRP